MMPLSQLIILCSVQQQTDDIQENIFRKNSMSFNDQTTSMIPQLKDGQEAT